MKLPNNKLIVMDNPDKTWHERWYKNRNLLNICHPSRICLLARPNSGKTNVIKNLLLRQHPPFEEVFVVHCDPESTQEYDDIDCEMLSHIPEPEEWDETKKTCVILDDLEYKSMDKQQRRCLDRLFGYVSTHKNCSVYLTSQDPFVVPPIVRRCSSVFILWRSPDLDSLANLSRKSGLKSHDLKNIFKNLMHEKHDSLWIDLTPGSPAPLRKNGYEIIERDE